MFERNAIFWLREWRKKSTRKPLVIRGARQVGKTSLVDAFGREFDCYIKFNLDIAEDLALFEKEQPVQVLYSTLLFVRGKRKDARSTLLFIDEIQNSPIAIKMLRYFFEELPHVHVIAAGSLLETMLHRNREVSFPVGRVEYMALRPCTFDEFLGAMGEAGIRQLVREVRVPEVLHSRVEKLFDLYTLIGGMPQVVSEFADTHDVVALNDVYQSLLAGYQDDVEKYTTSESSRNVIRHIVTNGWAYASEPITFDHFAASNYKSREVGEAFRTLEKTMLLELCYPTVQTNLPIVPDHKKHPKLLWLDTGLMNYAAGVQSELFGKDDINDAWRGKIAEHVVGQELLGTSRQILTRRAFWVRESKNSQAELDYLHSSREHGLVPIEVKAGGNAHLRSLQTFMEASSCKVAVRFWNKPMRCDAIALGDKNYTLLSLPYYYAGQLNAALRCIDPTEKPSKTNRKQR